MLLSMGTTSSGMVVTGLRLVVLLWISPTGACPVGLEPQSRRPWELSPVSLNSWPPSSTLPSPPKGVRPAGSQQRLCRT